MSVYRRGDAWYINLTLSGVRINRKAGGTEREAIDVEAELRYKHRHRKLQLDEIKDPSAPILFPELAGQYLQHCKATKAKHTHATEKSYYDCHLAAFFRKLSVQDITNEKLNALQGQLKKALAKRSVNICIGIVRKILNFAVINKIIDKPDLKYPRLKEPKKLHPFLTFEEFDRLAALSHDNMTIQRIIVGRHTGMRPAELAHLAWSDVNFDTGDIKIQGKKGIWEPKTEEERIIPMNSTVRTILTAMEPKRKGPWVFSKGKNPVLDIGKSLAAAAKSANIARNVTPNMLRHTFATHALMKGANLKSVQSIMGHADMETTAKYLHSIKEFERQAVNMLEPENSRDKSATSDKKKSRSKTGSKR